MVAWAIGVLAGLALLPVGCGGGADGLERAVEWSVDSPVDPNSDRVRLSATVEVCWHPVRLEEPIIEYSGDRVYIELRHTPEKGEGEHGGCLLGLLGVFKTITLERDLNELALYDASTDPAERRWPRQQCWPDEPCWPDE